MVATMTRSVVVLRISGGSDFAYRRWFNLFGDGIRDLLDPKAGGKRHDPTRSGHSTAAFEFPRF